MTITIEYAGELTIVDRSPFTLGREADLRIDDNRFLHRRFLALTNQRDTWVLSNIGDQLTATVSDRDGRFEAFLAPGAFLPIVVDLVAVRFSAGPTSYELFIHSPLQSYDQQPAPFGVTGATTVGRVHLTRDQRLLILALAEPALRGQGRGASALPSSGEAARRLGWTMTKFTRKLDNVCQKLTAAGVRGLHGDPGRLAANRRARLVEYALAVRLVTARDLPELARV